MHGVGKLAHSGLWRSEVLSALFRLALAAGVAPPLALVEQRRDDGATLELGRAAAAAALLQDANLALKVEGHVAQHLLLVGQRRLERLLALRRCREPLLQFLLVS